MSLHKILASVAIILGLGAIIVGSPTPDNNKLSSIARMIESEQDHITPIELAVILRERRNSIRIIDLRDSASFHRYHIPGAELMSLTELLNGGVKRNEHIFLYSHGGTHASQAWVLLKTKRVDSVFTLIGGMRGWESEILFPVLNSDLVEKKIVEQRKTLSTFFGGTPQIISQTPLKKNQQKKILPQPQRQQPLRKEEGKLRGLC